MIDMAIIWGDTEETREAAKNSFEENIERLLKEKGIIGLNELMKLIGHENTLITDYQKLFLGIQKLIEEGKIIIDQEKNLRMTSLSVLGLDGVDEILVWDLLHKEEEIELKKEIIRRYNEINPLL